MSTDEYCDLEADCNIETFTQVSKKTFADVEINTEPFVYLCHFCQRKENESVENDNELKKKENECKEKDDECKERNSKEVENNIDLEQYVKALNYINSMHELINEYINQGSNFSSNFQFQMPNFPNFLTVFNNLKKCETQSHSTTTSSLTNLCEGINETINKKNTILFSRNKENSANPNLYLIEDSDRGDVDCQCPYKPSKYITRIESSASRTVSPSKQFSPKKKINMLELVQKVAAKVDTRWKNSSLELCNKKDSALNAKPKNQETKYFDFNSSGLSEYVMDQLVANSVHSVETSPIAEGKNSSPKGAQKKRSPVNKRIPDKRATNLKNSPYIRIKQELNRNVKKPATAVTHSRPSSVKCKVRSSNSSPRASLLNYPLPYKHTQRVFDFPSISQLNKHNKAIRREKNKGSSNWGREQSQMTRMKTKSDLYNSEADEAVLYLDCAPLIPNEVAVVGRNLKNGSIERQRTFLQYSDSDASSDIRSDKDVSFSKIPVYSSKSCR